MCWVFCEVCRVNYFLILFCEVMLEGFVFIFIWFKMFVEGGREGVSIKELLTILFGRKGSNFYGVWYWVNVYIVIIS